jgi:hypothetical protein
MSRFHYGDSHDTLIAAAAELEHEADELAERLGELTTRASNVPSRCHTD